MPQDLTDDKSTLVQVMAWCRQATSHCLNQCWPRSPTPYGVTRPQWVNMLRPLQNCCHLADVIWVRSRRCSCLVTWLCYQLIAKPGNKTAAPPWPDPFAFLWMDCIQSNVIITRCNISLHSSKKWQQQNINQILNSQKTPHSSPLWASYGVSLVRILEKIDSVITALHCMFVFWFKSLIAD